ncbi:GNAT family N-acetyltransferase [Lutibacter sp. B2]|nr:GNAT family N-acetyltransferase [Lutibacter sp. B2]
MLEIRLANNQELDTIDKFLNENDQKHRKSDKLNYMVAYENEKIVGALIFQKEEDTAIINYIIVREDKRNQYIGEGLLKAMLSYSEHEGMTKAIVSTSESGGFFRKNGFVDRVNENLQKTILEVILPDYFLTSCKSCGVIK